MTSIDRLSISGIRSFNPDASHRQIINFTGPLTIILGKNGCGKTTIIEALLNATTGTLPPGASGAASSSFIYDPKIAGESNVKGQIRLQFKTALRHDLFVSRSFEAQQGRTITTNNKFTTLDSNIAFRDESGQIVSQSYRSGDADMMIPDLLGVPKPVLEHVVFCHQEECNWPLGPPKDLKEKFDDLFAATKYVGALEKLREQAKEHRTQQRGIEQLLISLKEIRKEAKDKNEQLKSKHAEAAALKDKIGSTSPLLVVFQNALKKLDGAKTGNEQLAQRCAQLRGRLAEVDKNINAALQKRGHNNNNNDFENQSLQELQNLLNGFDRELKKKQDEISKRDRQSDEINQKHSNITREIARTQTEIQLSQARRQEQEAALQQLVQLCERANNNNTNNSNNNNSNAAVVVVDPSLIQQLQQFFSSSSSTSSNNNNNIRNIVEPIGNSISNRQQQLRQELNNASNNFESNRAENGKKRTELQRSLDSFKKESDMLLQQVNTLKNRAEQYRREAASLGGGGGSGNNAENRIASLQQQIEQIRQRLAQEQQNQQNNNNNSQDQQNNIDSQIQQIQKELSQIRSEVSSLSSVKDVLSRVEMTKKHAVDHLQEKILNQFLPHLQLSQGDDNNNNNLVNLLQQLSSSISSSSSSSSYLNTNTIKTILDEAKKYQTTVSRLLVSHNEERRKEETTLSSLHRQLQDATQTHLKQYEREYSENENKLKQIQELSQYLTSSSSSNNDDIGKILEQQIIPQLDQQLQETNNKLAYRKADAENFSRYIEVARKENKCAVCDRAFGGGVSSTTTSSHKNVDCSSDDFIQRKEQELADTPQVLKQLGAERDSLQKRLELLRKLIPAAHRFVQLRDNLLPKTRKEISDLQTQISQTQQKVQKLTNESTPAIQKQNQVANDLVAEVSRSLNLVGEFQKEFTRMNTNNNNSNQKFSSLQQLEQHLSQLKQNEQDKNQQVSQLQIQYNEVQKQLKLQAETINKLNQDLINRQTELHNLEKSIAKRQEALKNAQSAQDEAEKLLKDKIESQLKQQIEQAKIALETFNRNAEGNEKQLLAQRTELIDRERDFSSIAVSITNLVQKIIKNTNSNNQNQNNNNNNEQQLLAKIKQLQQDQNNLNQELGALKQQQRVSQDEISTHHKNKSSIQEQIDLIELRNKQESLGQELKQSEEELNKILGKALREVRGDLQKQEQDDQEIQNNKNFQEIQQALASALNDNAARLRSLLQAEISQLERNHARDQGSLSTIRKDIQILTENLNSERYSDIDKKYTTAFIKNQTAELYIADIDKFYKVLEKAVSSYHREKIDQINKIINQLWVATYRGTDIDSIEIRSDDEHTGAGTGVAASSTARRSYKYRVIMKRGGMELDMRGRCSAGQKVLASVVIRLALSEAFCCDCGILALDEPTTNLDSQNAEALANSLRLLIEERAQRANSPFQLIVITHDEEFVRALGAKGQDTIHYVDKDKEGQFSQITPKTYGELFG